MSIIGNYRSIDKAIRDSLWNEADSWTVDQDERTIRHKDGLEIIYPRNTNRWTITEPVGYIKLGLLTHWSINAMIQGQRMNAAK